MGLVKVWTGKDKDKDQAYKDQDKDKEIDELLPEFRDRSLDVTLLCETWHDSDSVPIRRIRADGFRVVERARPRSCRAEASLGVNHGGVAIVATAGDRLTAVDVCPPPTTFECVAARMSFGPSSCIAVVVYHPGSSPVTAAFFAELADVLDRLSTFADSVVLAGDVNIRLERTTDPHAIEFCDLVASYGLVQRARGCTHDAGGTLVVVCTRDDLPPPTVNIIDTGLSDHRLLCWQAFYSVRRQSTSQRRADRGGRLMTTRFRLTSVHRHCATNSCGPGSMVMASCSCMTRP